MSSNMKLYLKKTKKRLAKLSLITNNQEVTKIQNKPKSLIFVPES